MAATLPFADAQASIRFRTLTSEHGLSENTIRAIAEDPRGYLWFGTEDGLNRFDGLEFQIFRAGTDGLDEDFVNELLVDHSGRLWVGSFSGGLYRYEPRQARFVGYRHDAADEHSLSHDDIGALCEDRNGTLWVGTRGGGLNRVDDRQLTRVSLPNQAAQPGLLNITSLACTPDNGLWIGTDAAGLLFYDPARSSLRAELANNIPFNREISALRLDRQGQLWLGTRRDGLARRAPDGTWRHWKKRAGEPGSLSNDTINKITETGNGGIWIATALGLDRYLTETDRFEHHRHDASDPGSLPFNDVVSVFEDSNGVLWAGTGGAGLARHAPAAAPFSSLDLPRSGSGESSAGAVWSLHEDGSGTLWVGTLSGGLFHRPPGDDQLRRFQSVPALSDPDVRGLLQVDGDLWIGTRRGLNRLDLRRGTLRQYFHDPQRADSLSHDFIRPLLRDAAGRLWVGTYGGGLERYEPANDSFVHYRHDPNRADSLSDDRIYSLLSDRDGMLWVGTHGGGLNRLDPNSGRVQRFSHDARRSESLSNDRVLALQQDRLGQLWVGTAGGLDRFESSSGDFEAVAKLQGRTVYGIAEDQEGRLWLSHPDGISRFEPHSGALHEFALKGLIGNSEFNGGAWHRGASGQIYFGHVRGLVIVDPSRPEIARRPPHPVLTNFRLFNHNVPTRSLDAYSPLTEEISFVDHIELGHDQNVIGFTFAALGTVDPLRHRFRYRLEGLSDRWIETSAHERQAVFTHIPAGTYQFRLQTSDTDGQWMAREANVKLNVLPAPWRSPWAHVAYVGLAALLLGHYGWQRRQRRQLKQRAQIELRESEERLSLALWGSGDELFDWDLLEGSVVRVAGARGSSARVMRHVRRIEDLRPLVHPDDFRAFSRAFEQHAAGQAPFFEATCRIGSSVERRAWRLLRGRIVNRDADGHPLRVVGTQKDVSQLKAVEEELRQLNEALDGRVRERTEDLEIRRRQLEETNARLQGSLEELRRTQSELIAAEKMAALGQLVAGVAHEVNTPLGIALTASSHLHERTREISSDLGGGALTRSKLQGYIDEADESTGLIERNLDRASHLVQSFKQVSVDRSSDGRRTFLLEEFLSSLLAAMRPQWKSRPISMEVDCPLDLALDSFPGALGQVLSNLIQNALLHAFETDQCGQMRILVRRLDGQRIELRFCDNGRGIESEHLQRIFEPFFTTKRNRGGTGLGLHILFNLVTQKLGGTVSVHSSIGEGCEFRIELPVTAP